MGLLDLFKNIEGGLTMMNQWIWIKDLKPKVGGRSSGFTLVEMLVVISVLGVLLMLLVPALRTIGHRALRMGCINNLKSIGTGCFNFAADNDDYVTSPNVGGLHGASLLYPAKWEGTFFSDANGRIGFIDEALGVRSDRTEVPRCPAAQFNPTCGYITAANWGLSYTNPGKGKGEGYFCHYTSFSAVPTRGAMVQLRKFNSLGNYKGREGMVQPMVMEFAFGGSTDVAFMGTKGSVFHYNSSDIPVLYTDGHVTDVFWPVQYQNDPNWYALVKMTALSW